MSSKVKPIPEGFHSVTPYLIAKDAAAAMDFYKKAFDATEIERITDADGKVRHGEVKIGDAPIMITDESREFPDYQSPITRGGTPVHMYLYVPNVDEVFNRAIAAGAKELRPVQDQFYGDRVGGLTDPFGHIWYVATHIENVSPEEIMRRAAQAR
jgi:PhnB protein